MKPFIDDKGNKLYGFSHLKVNLEKVAFWLKVMAISFTIFVIFVIGLFLWLKFSGIGHNIIYELSPK